MTILCFNNTLVRNITLLTIFSMTRLYFPFPTYLHYFSHLFWTGTWRFQVSSCLLHGSKHNEPLVTHIASFLSENHANYVLSVEDLKRIYRLPLFVFHLNFIMESAVSCICSSHRNTNHLKRVRQNNLISFSWKWLFMVFCFQKSKYRRMSQTAG